MALQIKDHTLLRQIDTLSRLRGTSKTDVLRSALTNELERETGKPTVQQRLKPLLDKVRSTAQSNRARASNDKHVCDESWGE